MYALLIKVIKHNCKSLKWNLGSFILLIIPSMYLKTVAALISWWSIKKHLGHYLRDRFICISLRFNSNEISKSISNEVSRDIRLCKVKRIYIYQKNESLLIFDVIRDRFTLTKVYNYNEKFSEKVLVFISSWAVSLLCPYH